MTKMPCLIEWNNISLPEWEARYASVRRAPLLQSYDYARAACRVQNLRARWGLVFIDGSPAGLVQVTEAGILGNALHAVMLDGGPVWFDGFGASEHRQAFFAAFAAAFPARFGRRRRVIPEIYAGDPAADALPGLGYRRLPRPGYRTIWLDLTQGEDQLLAGMDKSWRGALRKAQKSGTAVEWDMQGAYLSWLLTNYQADRLHKGYRGVSVRLLKALAAAMTPAGRFMIGRALVDNRAVAAILVLCHGTSATYQVGWTSAAGREAAASTLLLWQAVCALKEEGTRDFDLGGIIDEADGLTKFKQGLGGQEVVYAGQYR